MERAGQANRSLVTLYAARQRQRESLLLVSSPVPRVQHFGRRRAKRVGQRRLSSAVLLGGLSALLVGPTAASAAQTHLIRPGETLSEIAARYGTTVRALAELNGLANPDVILAGQRLLVSEPSGAARRHRVQPGETVSGIARRYGVSVDAIVTANGLADPDVVLAGSELIIPHDADASSRGEPAGLVHVVDAGETLGHIARRYGVDVAVLAQANGLPDPDRIFAGQMLRVPATRPAAAASGRGTVLSGLPVFRQSLPLSCEAAALSMVTAYYGRQVSEWVFVEQMPYHPNPHRGFRGDMNGTFGGTDDYGVYAEPLVPLLERYGFHAQVVYAHGDAGLLRAEIERGRPMVVWMTNLASVQPRLTGEHAGETFVLVPEEHVVVVYGYDQDWVYVADPGDGQTRAFAWGDFLRSWGYFDGMALLVSPAARS
jgi:LysM repeat protein